MSTPPTTPSCATVKPGKRAPRPALPTTRPPPRRRQLAASPQAAPATMRAASDFGRQQEHARVTPAATLVTCEDSRSKDDLRERSDGGKVAGSEFGVGVEQSGEGNGNGTGAGGAGGRGAATPLRRLRLLERARAPGPGGSWKSVFGGKRKIRWPRVRPPVRTLRERGRSRCPTSCGRAGRAVLNQNERRRRRTSGALHEGDDDAARRTPRN